MTVTHITLALSLLLSAPVAAQTSAVSSRMQGEEADPFRGRYLLGASSEMALFRADPADGTVYLDLFDANTKVENGLRLTDRLTVAGDWGLTDFHSARLDAVTADLNGDGFDAIIAAWERPNHDVALFSAEVDAASLTVSDESRLSLHDLGFPLMFEYSSGSQIHRQIRLATGRLLSEPGEQIVMAYFAADEEEESGPIQIVVFNGESNRTLEPIASISDQRMAPLSGDLKLQRGSLFDIVAGDFNGNGSDEIALVHVQPHAPSGGRSGWQLMVTIYDIDHTGQLVMMGQGPVDERPFNSNDAVARLSAAAGDLNNDFRDAIVIGYQVNPTNEAFMVNYLTAANVSGDLREVLPSANRRQVEQSRGDDGYPLSVSTGDVNRNGRDDVLLSGRQGLFMFSANDDLVFANLSFVSTRYSRPADYHRVAVLTDLDAQANDTLRAEVVHADENGLHATSYRGPGSHPPTASIQHPEGPVRPANMILVVGDFDGDAVRLGPPRRARHTEVVQPLVVLNAPPTHFDVFDGTVYDVNKCFNLPPLVSCGHEAFYSNAQQVSQEVETEVRSDWGVSRSLTGEVSIGAGPIGLSVRGSLERTYGERFSRIDGNEVTFTVSSTSGATYDDRVYASVIDYVVLEYPVYADGDVVGHVLSVIPEFGGARNAWFSGKSARAATYRMPHEVGNVLSYPSTPTLPEGARVFGSGRVSGGGDQWEMSAQSTQEWELAFSSTTIEERERAGFQSVSRSVEGDVSFTKGIFSGKIGASLGDTYDDDQIATHRTTVRTESAIRVYLGQIDGSILGTKTYTVTPFVYWSDGGALVLDYAVQVDESAGVPSWWTQRYGSAPDLAFSLPWRYDAEKGIASTDPGRQREETRDIAFNPDNPKPGETVSIYARVHNFGLQDMDGPATLRFYLGNPRAGGSLIEGLGGASDVPIPPLPARSSTTVQLDGWTVPTDVARDAAVYAVLDPEGVHTEVHTSNNIGWTNLSREAISTHGETEPITLPGETSIALESNYPNPFNESTTIVFHIDRPGHVNLSLFDLMGRKIATLIDQAMPAGRHEISYDASMLPSGVYVCRLSGEHAADRRLITLVR